MAALLKDATISDIVRCGLALMIGLANCVALLMRVPLPAEWVLLTGAVFGFYFGMETPKMMGQRGPQTPASAARREEEKAA